MSYNTFIHIANEFNTNKIGNNIIEHNCRSIILKNSSDNIINSSCRNVSLYMCESSNI
jgi:hypothetical protein